MGRLIDVEALADELKMHVDNGDGHVLKEEYETVMFFVDCYSETVDPTPKWIPLTEQQPELFENVIVHYQNGVVDVACMFPVTGFLYKQTKGVVTHWMKLPDPPEMETE